MIGPVTAIPPDLLELAHAYGVATEFYDWRGRRVDVPEPTVSAVLAAMDVDVSDPSRALAGLTDQHWLRMLPACVVVQQGQERTFQVHVTDEPRVNVGRPVANPQVAFLTIFRNPKVPTKIAGLKLR